MDAQTTVYKNGIVELGSPLANAVGFTADKFEGYLWLDGSKVWISFIVSLNPGTGNLSRLFDAIELMGYSIVVPTPLGKMEQILRQKGFSPRLEHSNAFEESYEVWEKSCE